MCYGAAPDLRSGGVIRHRIRRRLLGLAIAVASLLLGIVIGANVERAESRVEVVEVPIEVERVVTVEVEVERVVTVEVERVVTVEVTPSPEADIVANRIAVLRDIRVRELQQLERIRALQEAQSQCQCPGAER